MKLFLLLGLIALAWLVVEIGGGLLALLPDYQYIAERTAFVYPDGDEILVALPQGPYRLEHPLNTGCYHLSPPAAGEIYGSARLVWPTCRRRPAGDLTDSVKN